jgi:hypothetical protein
MQVPSMSQKTSLEGVFITYVKSIQRETNISWKMLTSAPEALVKKTNMVKFS